MAKFTAAEAKSCKVVDAKVRTPGNLEVVVRDGDGLNYFLKIDVDQSASDNDLLKAIYNELLVKKTGLFGQSPKDK